MVLLQTSFSVSVEEKVCGYLRHISSNTCVGEHDAKFLTANTTYCSKEDHLFCYDANKMIITRSRDGKIISVLDPDPVSDSILVLTDKNEGQYVWRFRINGEIRLIYQGQHKCWRRYDNGNSIKLETCSDKFEPNFHQFGFQILYEASAGIVA